VTSELGAPAKDATEYTCEKHGCTSRALRKWRAIVRNKPRIAWLPLLLLEKGGKRDVLVAEIPDTAWCFYSSYYLSREQPTHAMAYARAEIIAKKHGWQLPNAKTFIRRLNAEFTPDTQKYMREGEQKWARTLPPMRRDRSVFGVGEAVNGDGLKFDRHWVQFKPSQKPINTATGWFWQDIRSSKILAFRIGQTENTNLFRLATYDLTAHCSPTYVLLDNTRVAANKVMTGGVTHRNRFRKKKNAEGKRGGDFEPRGLLVGAMGAQVHFTNPDKVLGNPGAKPIERAFGIGGIHEAVANHPRLAGRGRSASSPITADELRAVVIEEVARLNAQKNRRGSNIAAGNSFNDEWDAGIARGEAQIRLSKSARDMFLRSFETRTVNGCGEVVLQAGRGPHGDNRYWSEGSAALVGQRVSVFYDPADLSKDVYLYTPEGRYLCAAQHKPAYAFNDVEAAGEHAKFKERQRKAKRAEAEAAQSMRVLERIAVYGEVAEPAFADTTNTMQPETATATEPRTSNVLRLTRDTVSPQRDEAARATNAPANNDVTELDYTDVFEANYRKRNPLFDL
jgi:hypothetical protein